MSYSKLDQFKKYFCGTFEEFVLNSDEMNLFSYLISFFKVL